LLVSALHLPGVCKNYFPLEGLFKQVGFIPDLPGRERSSSPAEHRQRTFIFCKRQRDPPDVLTVIAVERIGDTQKRSQRYNKLPVAPGKRLKIRMTFVGQFTPVVSGYLRNNAPLSRCKTGYLALFDQIPGVLVMTGAAHEHTDVVEQGSCMEQRLRLGAEAVFRSGLIEQQSGQPGNLPGVRFIEGIPPAEIGKNFLRLDGILRTRFGVGRVFSFFGFGHGSNTLI
jgi:hypothetical protein